ncbi:hypothetical protein ACN47E_008381 [Coniothyrium glycines]
MADTDYITRAQDEGQGDVSADASVATALVEATRNTISLQLFDGMFKYVLPLEQCESYETIKPVIEEIFLRLERDDLLEHVRKGEYDIGTVDGFIILPSLWKSIIKPGSTIQILFRSKSPDRPSSKPPSESRYRRRRQSPIRDSSDEEAWYTTEKRSATPEVISVADARRPPSPWSETFSEADESDISQEDEDIEEESEPDPSSPEPIRIVNPALDADGNALSYGKKTTRAWNHQSVNSHGPIKEASPQAENQLTINTTEPGTKPTPMDAMRVTRAMITVQDNRNMIEIHTLPAPEASRLGDAVSLTWYSIASDKLDYNRFRDACLTISSMSERRRTIVGELLRRVEKDKVKAFLNGMFIDPGTVLRVDEEGQADPECAIFSCLPYFDIAPAPKKSPANLGDRLFPARTLMQSYYPYEPVRDRDAEQAYKKFGNDESKGLVHVPNLWMVNISSDTVITYGHRPLAEEMVKSIAIISDDLKPMSSGTLNQEVPVHVRITDPSARVFMFPHSDCESYFQLEQKIFELRCSTSTRKEASHIRVELRSPGELEDISPQNWRTVARKNRKLNIDVQFYEERKKPKHQIVKRIERADISEIDDLTQIVTPAHGMPPFFAWPITEESTQSDIKQGIFPPEVQRSLKCLEKVEKSFLSETLLPHETKTAVDKTFTSTTYYQSLHEDTWDNLKSQMAKLAVLSTKHELMGRPSTYHQSVVQSQCVDIGRQCTKFIATVHQTFEMFVKDVDKNTFLRKIWGAMAKILEKVQNIEQRKPTQSDQKREAAWFVRNASNHRHVPLPEAGRYLKSTIRRCSWCKEDHPFDSFEEATKHLQNHAAAISQRNAKDGSVPANSSPLGPTDLQDWVLSYSQRKREETNGGALRILKQACAIAAQLLADALDLAAGVQNADGRMSSLYILPSRLITAFRQIVVFYLATERALHFTEESFQKDNLLEDRYDEWYLPYNTVGLDVLQRFGDDAALSLRISRRQLCHMVRSDPPIGIKQLSLSPEYVCAWLMRRLIVKPLDRRMTIGDMYREYLSTVQFQVNHRPGKRLLRDINLLQEELNILVEINAWQTKLIDNYTRVLDDSSYEKDIPHRRANFPYEQTLLQSCLDTLALAREDLADLIRRCGPLSDRTKQSLEINEEDHGKAIMVFTVVTVIFLPLSFVTSYLGMNTADLRDMGSNQSLFYIIAVPLTVVTVGACMLIGYNGDTLRDFFSSIHRSMTGKEDHSTSARGISVAQRKRARQLHGDSSSAVDFGSLAVEAEFANPQPECRTIGYISRNTIPGLQQTETEQIETIPFEETFEKTPMLKTARPIYTEAAPPMRTRRDYDRAYVPPLRSDYRTGAQYNLRYPNPPPYVRPALIYGDEDEHEGYTWYKKGSGRRKRAQESSRR